MCGDTSNTCVWELKHEWFYVTEIETETIWITDFAISISVLERWILSFWELIRIFDAVSDALLSLLRFINKIMYIEMISLNEFASKYGQ